MEYQPENTTTTLPPIYSAPTITEVFEPRPLTQEEQLSQLGQKYEEQLNPTLEAVDRLSNPDYAFATADMEIQQHLSQALSPIRTAHNTANTAFKTGLKFYAVTHPLQATQLISQMTGFHPAAAAALGTGALLFGEPFYNKLRETEWQMQSLSHPGVALEHKITSKVQQSILQATLPVLSKPLVALGYSLGLLDTAKMPHAFDPNVQVLTPIFKPTRWLQQKPAELFEKWANKTKSTVIKNGLQQYSHLLKARKRWSLSQWLLYPFVLAGELGAELLFSFIESKSPQLAYLMRGFSGSIARGLFSVNTGLSAWGGYAGGNALAGPIGGAALGTAAGLGGWYYQSLLNLANNYHSIPAYMFEYPSLASSVRTRIELMPTSYAKIYGPSYYNNPLAVQQYLKDFGYKIEGTQFRGQAGTADYQLLNGRYLTQEGTLGKVFGQPARLMFKYKILQTLPLRGFYLGPILGLPFLGKTHLQLMAADFALRLMETNPVLNKIKNSALLGAAVGAELAWFTGQTQFLGAYAGVGAALGASIQGLNLLASADVPAWTINGKLYYAPAAGTRLVSLDSIAFNTKGELVFNPDPRATPFRPMANFWQIADKGNCLANKLYDVKFFDFPIGEKLANTSLFKNLFSGLNKANLGWVSKLRYLRGPWTGGLIGIQLFLLTGNPAFLWIGPAAGTIAQVAWDLKIATAAAGVSQKIASFTRYVGTKVLPAINVVASLWFAVSSYASFLTSPTSTNRILAIVGSTVAVITLVSLGLPLWLALATTLALLLIEGIAQQAFHFSVVGWITNNIFKPIGNFLGKTFGPFFRGIVDFTGDAVSAGLGFLMGLLQAAAGTNLQSQVAGWATAAFSVGTIGTGLITMISASGFFSGVPGSMRRLATGFLSLTADKQLLATKTNANNQVISANYQINYSYSQALVDEETGQPIPGTATDLEINDEFTSPRNLDKNDVKVINYSPASLPSPTKKQYPLQIIFSGLNPDGLVVGESDSLTLKVEFSKPLPELLQDNHACSLCNQAVFTAKVPKSASATAQAKTISQTICINAQGKHTSTPSDLAARNLINFLQQCYVNSCDPGVSKQDFTAPDDYDPEKPFTGCVDPKEVAACEQIYMPYYNINDAVRQIVRNDTLDPNNQSGYLRTLAFIQAAEFLQRRSFPVLPNPEDYKQLNEPNGYIYHLGTDGYVVGDIAIIYSPVGYMIAEPALGQIGLTMILLFGEPAEFNPVPISDIAGYLHYGPDTCL